MYNDIIPISAELYTELIATKAKFDLLVEALKSEAYLGYKGDELSLNTNNIVTAFKCALPDIYRKKLTELQVAEEAKRLEEDF